jgi:hypothetical protein
MKMNFVTDRESRTIHLESEDGCRIARVVVTRLNGDGRVVLEQPTDRRVGVDRQTEFERAW